MAQNLLDMDPSERAAAGLFLAFQYPIEIPGVATMTFLKAAMNAQRKARGEGETVDARFHARGQAGRHRSQYRYRNAASVRSMSASRAARRSAPKCCRWRCCSPRCASSTRPIPGLDIDALQVVSKGVNALRSPNRSMLVITHYQRLLNHIVPDVVHVFSDGRIVESGGKELALQLEAKGYADFDGAAA